jgi:hypothetical protein
MHDYATLHTTVQRIQPVRFEPRSGCRSKLLRVQLHQGSPYAADESRDGCWRHQSVVGRCRPGDAVRVMRAEGGKGGMTNQKLTVHELPDEDRWKDMARIPRAYRVDVSGNNIRRAKICNVTVGGKQKLLAIRGWPEKEALILLDSPTRNQLGVAVGEAYEFQVRPVKWLGYWRWAWGAADPAYRVPAQISLISLVLGVIGLVLGLLPFILSWLEQAK